MNRGEVLIHSIGTFPVATLIPSLLVSNSTSPRALLEIR